MTSANGSCGADPECDALTGWSKFTAIKVGVSQPGQSTTTDFSGVFDHQSFDFMLDIDVRDPSRPMKGKIGMVAGRTMISRGLKLPGGYEIDAIDGPVLQMRLVTILLGRVFPAGPDSVKGRVPIDHEGKVGIKYATPSAQGYVPAPWKLKGEVRKASSAAP